MTCIVGYIDKVAYIGGDSAASGGDSVNIRKDPKVFRNGDFIFGCTSLMIIFLQENSAVYILLDMQEVLVQCLWF